MSPDHAIILAQINPTLGDLAGNAALMADICAAHTDATLVVFPELGICGYPPEDLVLKPFFVQSCMDMVQTLAARTRDFPCGILVGTPWRDDAAQQAQSLPYNAAVLLHGGEIKAVRFKHDLPNYDVFDEKRTFLAGPLPDPVEFAGRRYGIMVCEDMWNPRVAAHLKGKGADILIVPNGSPFETGKQNIRLQQAKARVRETGLALIYVNQVGGQDELVFDGGSFVLDASGAIISQLPFFQTAAQGAFCAATTAPEHGKNAPDENALIYDALVLGLRDYVRKNGANGVILGLSGGVDSALVAAIAVDAFGAQNVHCVMMPSPFTSQDSLKDAAILAKNLGVRLDTVPITPALQAFEATLPGLSGLAHENIQSRLRGVTLMALSNAEGKMLITTGNKSEMAVGYATIYGDMNGAYNPLKDVYKTRVYALCRWKNTQAGFDLIPENILTKAPSAELRDNQKDQDSLPPYDVLDGILEMMIEGEAAPHEICAANPAYDRATVERIWRLLDRAEFKRYQAPPGAKITAKAFGRDRRYPMTNQFIKTVEKA